MVNKHEYFLKLLNDKMPTCMSNLLSSASRHVRKYFFIMRMSSRSFCESRKIILHYIPLYYVTLRALRCVAWAYVALRGLTLRCVALRCAAWPYVALRYVARAYVALHVLTLRCVALRGLTLRCVALRCVVYVTLRCAA